MQALPVNIRMERNLSKEGRDDFTIFFLYTGVFSLYKRKNLSVCYLVGSLKVCKFVSRGPQCF